MQALELIKKESIKLVIEPSNCAENPLIDWSCPFTVLYTSSRYNLGNEQVSDLPERLFELLGYGENYINKLYDKFGDSIELIEYLIDRLNKSGYYATKVYAYIHSGVVLSTTPFACRWDSGLSGVAYVKRSDYNKECGTNKANFNKIDNSFKNYLKSFNDFLNDNVYDFTIEDKEGNVLDSCGGFFGDNYAESMLDYIDFEYYGYSKDEFLELIKNTEITYN